MERSVINSNSLSATLLIMEQAEFDYFLAMLAMTPNVDDKILDDLVETEFLPFLVKNNDNSDLFDIYRIETPVFVVVGPSGHRSALGVLRGLDDDDVTYEFIPKFSSN